jgi:membrane-associated phospholipid phosphatase
MMVLLRPLGSIWRIGAVRIVLAVAAVGAAPLEIRAQQGVPAERVNVDPSTHSDLLGSMPERRSPFRNLFVPGVESPLASEPESFDRLTIEARRYEVDAGPRPSVLRERLQEGRAQTHPPPAHTGFKALIFDTASDFKAYGRRQSTWVILGIGGAAAALAHPVDDEVNDKLTSSDTAGKVFAAGKYIGSFYVQTGAAVGLYVVGRYVLPHADGAPRTNKVSHVGFDMLRALIVSQTLTQGIKMSVRRDRPTGECCAFPSGHASATFATASVLERHFGYRGSWPMFLIASYVATSRLHDNRHFLSDVLFGAAVGMSSGWTVVGRHGRSQYALVPVPVRGGMLVALTRKTSVAQAP